MASVDDVDDFTLLSTDPPNHHHHHHNHRPPPPHHNHNHHHHFNPHRFVVAKATPTPIHTHPPPPPIPDESPKSIPPPPAEEDDDPAGGDDGAYADGFCSQFDDDASNPFDDDSKSRATNSRLEKRKDRDELSDGGTPYYKRSKSMEYRSDCRKDREEWSDSAIGSLLDAYTDKYEQLNRGNLRGRDWEEVAAVVSSRCDKSKAGKSVDQCKNKVDNLKKRYKVELQRMTSSGSPVSHWIWFKKIEQIVNSSTSTSTSTSKAVSDDDNGKSVAACGGSGGGGVNAGGVIRQARRYPTAANVPAGLVNNLNSKMLANPRWRRVVFKISGAALAGTASQSIDPKVALLIAREVAIACRRGVEVAIVVGGRNFFCGESWVTATGLDRPTACQIGMMATVMNAVLLQSALEKLGVQTRVQTAFPMPEVAEPYSKRRAIRHLEKGRVVIFGGIGAGMGNPLFTTDTAAALRAAEVNAGALLKGTDVDSMSGCNSRNTNTTADDNSVTFEHISFRELVSRGMVPMDVMAITFCEESGIPVVIFNLHEQGNISRALCGDQIGIFADQAGRTS